jgi:formylglycine-generating enzyme required for sulfatase activity
MAALIGVIWCPTGTVAAEEPLLEQPPALIAPFDAESAARAQRAWAKFLKAKVDQTNSIRMELRLIPPGKFLMGTGPWKGPVTPHLRGLDHFAKKETAHDVEIHNAFYIGTCEVAIDQWREFVTATGYKTDAETNGLGGSGYDSSKEGVAKLVAHDRQYNWSNWGFDNRDDHPVVNVSWDDATAFCNWLSKKDRKTYRLPTEAEWEYACRGGTTDLYYFGDDPEMLTKFENVLDSSGFFEFGFSALRTPDGHALVAPLASFRANPFGLYDMLGNVSEWCQDWHSEEYYRLSPAVDPLGPTSGAKRVVRGGSWAAYPVACRCAFRDALDPGSSSTSLGFRVVLER